MSHPRRPAVMIVAVVLVAAACSSSPTPNNNGDVARDRWTPRAAAPSQRTEVTAGALGGRIWVIGGMSSSGQPTADVEIYDPIADSWTVGPPLPEPAHHPAAGSDGARLWVAGGYVDSGGSHRPTDAVRVIDAANGTWKDVPALPSPRAAGALAWDGKRLLFAGGVGPDGLAGDIFALAGDQWHRLGQLSTAREHLAAASDGQGNTWFLAGRLGGLDTNRADVDLVSDDRVRRVGAIPTPRGGVAGFFVPGLGPCVAGGEQNAGTFAEVECIAADGSTATLPSLGASRHGLGAVTLDGIAYTLLGGPSPGLTVSNVIEALRIDGR